MWRRNFALNQGNTESDVTLLRLLRPMCWPHMILKLTQECRGSSRGSEHTLLVHDVSVGAMRRAGMDADNASLALRARKDREMTQSRFVYDPATVRPVDEKQVLNIVNIVRAMDPELTLTDEQISSLKININAALKWITPSLDSSTPLFMNLEGIREAVRGLSGKLRPENVQLLRLIGAAVHGQFRPRSGDIDVPREVQLAIRALQISIDEILQWLNDDKASDRVKRSLKQAVPLQTFLGHLLPDLFQMTFRRKFTTGSLDTPGLRFAVAVVRETGIRAAEDDDYDVIAEQIKQARRRETSKSKRL